MAISFSNVINWSLDFTTQWCLFFHGRIWHARQRRWSKWTKQRLYSMRSHSHYIVALCSDLRIFVLKGNACLSADLLHLILSFLRDLCLARSSLSFSAAHYDGGCSTIFHSRTHQVTKSSTPYSMLLPLDELIDFIPIHCVFVFTLLFVFFVQPSVVFLLFLIVVVLNSELVGLPID